MFPGRRSRAGLASLKETQRAMSSGSKQPNDAKKGSCQGGNSRPTWDRRLPKS